MLLFFQKLKIYWNQPIQMSLQEFFSVYLRLFTRHWLTTSIRLLFSKAAETLSLSANCLLTASSDAWDPGEIITSTFKLGGKDLIRHTLIESPMSVAIEQWGMVGV